jgi:glycosyltransferase involved in cell wall biosynthesis
MINAKSSVQSPKPETRFRRGEKFSKQTERKPENKIKIVRIIARLNVGGPARHVVWLTEAMNAGEFESVLIAGTVPEGEEDMSYFAAQHAVVPVYIEEMSRELSPKDIICFWKIYRRLVKEKPDIVDTHTAKAGTVGRAAGFFYRWFTFKTLIGRPRPVRFVHTYHGHVFHSYYGKLKTNFFLAVEKILARLATDKIITVSEQQTEEINCRFKVGRASQFVVVPYGVELSVFREWRAKRDVLRREINLGDEKIIVGIVGRLTEIKNHTLFLQAAKLYKAGRDAPSAPLHFVIVGDGHLRSQLETEAAALNVADIVTFLGNREDADVFHAGFDIEALTSLNEGSPFVLIEAMANARPIVSTAVGGVVDLLGAAEESRGGFTVCERGVSVPSKDAPAFCEALIYLAKNRDLRERLSRRGEKYAIGKYSKERLVSDSIKVYRGLF